MQKRLSTEARARFGMNCFGEAKMLRVFTWDHPQQQKFRSSRQKYSIGMNQAGPEGKTSPSSRNDLESSSRSI